MSLLLLAFALASSALRAQEAAPRLEPLGFAQFWYTHDFNRSGSKDQILAQRIRPGFTYAPRPDVRFFMLTEFGDGNPTTAGAGTLLDAHITWRPHPLLALRAGQDWYKFTLEGTWTLFEMPFILRSEAVDAVWLKLGRNGSFSYDRGLWAFGRTPDGRFGYAASVTGGAGLNKADDNPAKDLAARVFVEPRPWLHLGASSFRGASRVSPAAGPKLDLDEKAYAVELIQTFGSRARVIAEALWADYDGAAAPAVKASRPSGWYAAVGVKAAPRLEVLARYAEYRPDRRASDASLRSLTLGLTWTIRGFHNLRVNYVLRENDPGYAAAAGAAAPRDLLVAQWQVFFFPPDLEKSFLRPFAE